MKRELETTGFAVVPGVFSSSELEELRHGLYTAQKNIVKEIGEDRLKAAKEVGVLRIICKYSDTFLSVLQKEKILEIVDTILGPTSVLHLQNGFILPPTEEQDVFQFHFHRDFPRLLGGYLCSLNIMVAVDEFTKVNGATIVVPGTQQKENSFDVEKLRKDSIPVECPAGSIVVFDSTLIHCAGVNRTNEDRLAINHQFTRSYFKQQIDYVRALGDNKIKSLPERTKQLLGWYTRVPTSLNEYYRPESERLYRKGQG